MTDPLSPDVLMEPEHAEEFLDLFGKACPPQHQANPRFIFQVPDVSADYQDAHNLTEEFAALADDMRELYTDFGQRPERVFSVVYSWSGGEEGKGDLAIVSEREFLPRPLVDTKNSRFENTEAGQRMQGSAKLTEVSWRMTEDEIFAYFPVAPLPRGHFAFIEVRTDARDGVFVVRKRYTVKDPPYRNIKHLCWEVPLIAQQHPRTREGELTTPQLYPPRLRQA